MFMNALPDQLVIHDTQIEYLRMGAGRSLLYLHGCDGIDAADPFVQPLSEHFDLIALSLPGFGASQLPRTVSTMEGLVEFCLELIESLNLNECILVGSSFGGWVAAEIAVRRSDHFSHLILADTLGARFTGQPDEREILDIFTVPAADIPPLFFAQSEAATLAFGNMQFSAMPDGAALRYCRNREALAVFGWAPLLYNPALRARLRRIDIPTLVLWGENDRIVRGDYGRAFADAIPNAEFHVVCGAGHYLPLEKPAEFTQLIAQFVGAGAN